MGSMRRIAVLAAASTLAVLLLAGAWPGNAFAETLRIGGTGGALGGIARVAEAFREAHPEVEVTILAPIGSTGGIRAAIAGSLDIGISARPLSPEERDKGGQGTPYARTAFVFAVNQGVPISGITVPEAVDVFSGKKERWAGGTPVRLILRHLYDTDAIEIREMSPELFKAYEVAHRRKGMIVARTDKECADWIEKTSGAFGTTTLSQVISEKRRIKILSVAGVTPSVEAIRDGSYPYTKTFHLVTGPSYSTAAAKFKRFLRSPKAVNILVDAGHAENP